MTARGGRGWTVALIALALAFPLGALLLPSLWPARSEMPAVPQQLDAPIVLITAAGLRPDRLGPRRDGPSLTPNLDRLAEEGVSFLGAWSASNESLASAAALLTGRCPRDLGVRHAGQRLAPEAETLAERCAAAGYLTAAVVSNPELLDAGLEQGFVHWEARARASADEVVELGLQRVRGATGPWLLWLDLAELAAPEGYGAGTTEASHDAALVRLDAAIGRLLDALAADGRLETGTVCVTGLRGVHLGQSAVLAHADLSEAFLRVPLLLRLPGRQPRGLQLARLAQGIDIAPTLADFWLHDPWTSPTGRSLRPAIQARHHVHRSILADGWLAQANVGAVAVRYPAHGGAAKAVLADDGRCLGLWNLANDPAELHSTPLDAGQVGFLRQSWAADLGAQAACLPPAR